MSIVIAVSKNGQTVMAADTQSNFGSRAMPRDNQFSSKIRRVGDALLGRTGWGIYENILDDVLAEGQPPDLAARPEVFRFFTEVWKTLRQRYSFVTDRSGRKDSPFGDMGGSFLIARPGVVFYVSPNLGVSEFRQYFAIGSGSDYALGALYQLYDGPDDAEQLARRAVETASALNVHCGGGVELIEL